MGRGRIHDGEKIVSDSWSLDILSHARKDLPGSVEVCENLNVALIPAPVPLCTGVVLCVLRSAEKADVLTSGRPVILFTLCAGLVWATREVVERCAEKNECVKLGSCWNGLGVLFWSDVLIDIYRGRGVDLGWRFQLRRCGTWINSSTKINSSKSINSPLERCKKCQVSLSPISMAEKPGGPVPHGPHKCRFPGDLKNTKNGPFWLTFNYFCCFLSCIGGH